ncbi:MAG: serine/threonine-protein kinase [Victivallaceae bacterium]|nr:serine/threonine-protein kinase [Victivallaceae bacterium]
MSTDSDKTVPMLSKNTDFDKTVPMLSKNTDFDKTVPMLSKNTDFDKTVPMLNTIPLCPECSTQMTAHSELDHLNQCPRCAHVSAKGSIAHSAIDGYKILRQIGSGGMGRVFLCYPLDNPEQLTALKLVFPGQDPQGLTKKRFQQEAKLSSLLKHPNIVEVYGSGIDHQSCYIIMEYIDGKDLESVVADAEPMRETQILDIAAKLSHALSYAWDEFKILHRDIKPSNIMLNSQNEAKLMDFGIAKSLSLDSSTNKITMTNHCVGTPHFMSIEQSRDSSRIDCRSDIFSLGASLYFLLTKRHPFPGDNLVTVVGNMLKDAPEPLEMVNPEVSKSCARLIHAMIAANPDERPRDWDMMLNELDRVERGLPPQSQRLTKPQLNEDSLQLALKMNYGDETLNTANQTASTGKLSFSERLRRGFFKKNNPTSAT